MPAGRERGLAREGQSRSFECPRLRSRETTNKKQNSNLRHTMPKPILYVGLDVHARKITLAAAIEARGAEVRFHSTIETTATAVDGLIK